MLHEHKSHKMSERTANKVSMKRNPYAFERDRTQRAQRLALLRHDVPDLAGAATTVPSHTPLHPASTDERSGVNVDDWEDKIGEWVDARVGERVAAWLAEHEDAAPSTPTDPVRPDAQQVVASPHPEPARADHEPQHTRQDDAGTPPRPSHSGKGADVSSRVRVVSRKQISAKSVEEETAPSLARPAKVDREKAARAARCLAHAGQHYRGATEADVIDAWNAMRERFHVSADNKIVARRALLQWLQRERNVCANNIHWYGDLVAVRSCHIRVAPDHHGYGVDGWFLLFDPNGDGFLRSPLFAEAFETPNSFSAASTPRLIRPAWLSEENRERAAITQGGPGRRAFSPETADALTSEDFFRGRAE